MSVPVDGRWTVARYLSARLAELGVTDLFGVPGNHLGPFLPVARQAGIRWVGNCNEINGGYAADGYARATGRLGAVAVTYGVGALSVIQPVGGAYVEQIPLVVITGAPTYEQWQNLKAIGLLTSHMSPNTRSNVDAFRQVTVDAQVVTSSRMAPVQIDGVLTACLTERRPVYLEVWENVWDGECDAPAGPIVARPRPTSAAMDRMRTAAVDEAVALMEKLGCPILWGGEEIDRYGLRAEFESLVDATGLPFCTTIGGKSAVSENHPLFHGVYNGKASLPEIYRMFQDVAGCRVGLGSWATSKNLGGTRSVGDDWIVAAHQGVSVGPRYFPDIKLGEFITSLRDALVQRRITAESADAPADYYSATEGSREVAVGEPAAAPPADAGLTYDGFFARISAFLDASASGEGTAATSPYVVVSDAGFSLLGSQNLKMPQPRTYFCQGSWLAIGYSVGAVTGVKAALPEKRALVFVGDGSFQETCQELSTHTRLRQDNVVFVMNNDDFYGIEQMLVHPCFYDPASGEEPGFYNVLHKWKYSRLAQVFSGPDTPMAGVVVGTHGELDALLGRLGDGDDAINAGPVLVQVRLPREDYPRAIHYEVKKNCGSGKH
ncbi:MAG TPA: thiamine pyrophosphate-binding protein [Longimicrobium sp.]|jgi:indolepyruvate decarboxylase|uniref:alpha-keto acid decarboxylase family protein n=1 Tax=Longimicrobium sp. TaxID=2029185 RepID=UPI002ED859F4